MSFFTGLAKLGKTALRFCSNNASGILTITAMVGVVATAIISAECKKAAEEAIKEEEEIKGEPLTFKEKAKRTWYYYIPPVVCSGITIACIGGAHGIDKKKQLELIAAYNILRESSDKFKKYAVEEIGKNKVKTIEHKVHEEQLKEDPVKTDTLDKLICDAATGGVILKDNITGQEFPTTYERIYRAAERCNEKLRPYGKGGYDWWSWSNFIEDCGGEYSEAAENWGWQALPFNDNIDVNSICDPHVEEYNGHRCTVVYLNLMPDRRDMYGVNF